jgi:hypothetical protein
MWWWSRVDVMGSNRTVQGCFEGHRPSCVRHEDLEVVGVVAAQGIGAAKGRIDADLSGLSTTTAAAHHMFAVR